MYPIAGLEIVAPVIFIVLVCLFPLIGLLAGWKKGVFWGAGFLIFYIIGLLIWTFLGTTIAEKLSTLITNLIAQITGQTFEEPLPAEFVKSILTPFYFLIVMAISVLILLINYFAWYRRVVGLKKVKVKDKKTGKITKEYLKVNKNAGKGWYKAVNRLGGFVALGALTLPSTITFTQFTYLVTTITASRENNKLSKDLYERLQVFSKKGIEKAFYIQKDTFLDYDSLLSAVSMIGKEVDVPDVGPTKVEDVIIQGIGTGVGEIFTSLMEMKEPKINLPEITPPYLPDTIDGSIEYDISVVWPHVNNLAKYWNAITTQYEKEIASFFSSLNVLPTINKFIKPFISQAFSGLTYVFDNNSIFEEEVEIKIQDIPVGTINIEIPFFTALFTGGTLSGSIHITQPITKTIQYNIAYSPLFKKLIDDYEMGGEGIDYIEPVIIPTSNFNEIAQMFYSFFSITDNHKVYLKENYGINNADEILFENISNFVRCALTDQQPTPPNQQ